MKKLSLLFLIFFLTAASYAQMHISTNLREDYDWNSKTSSWDFNTDDKASATLFDFNKDMNMFKHTTANISSAYYIKSNTYDKDSKTWEYEVVSDVGNKYRVILDPDRNNIRFIGTRSDGSQFLVRHTIKRLWYDD